MKRKLLVLVTMLMMLASCADWAVAQGPLRPQDGEAAAVVKTIKWEYLVWSGSDTLVNADTLTGGWKELYVADYNFNRWATRVYADTAAGYGVTTTAIDSFHIEWQYQLWPGATWLPATPANGLAVGQIAAAELTAPVVESWALTLTALPEKPYKIRFRGIAFSNAATEKIVLKKILAIFQ